MRLCFNELSISSKNWPVASGRQRRIHDSVGTHANRTVLLSNFNLNRNVSFRRKLTSKNHRG